MEKWAKDPAARRKYFTEFGINGWNEYALLVHPSDLGRPEIAQEDERYPFHIYAVCQHPRIRIDPASPRVAQASIDGVFIVCRGAENERVPFTIPNRLPHGNPGTVRSMTVTDDGIDWAMHDGEGQRVSWGRSPMLLRTALPFHDANDLEILYVGKSFGSSGERTAPSRLASHSTLQRILADMVRRTDVEPLLLLLNYEYQSMISMDGVTGVYGTTNEEDNAHIRQVLAALYEDGPGHEMTSYTEAALIRHYAPTYNKQMFVTFPDAGHVSYQRLYELDLLHLSVVLETKQGPLCCFTWSESQPRLGMHIAEFELHDTKLRAGHLEFLAENEPAPRSFEHEHPTDSAPGQ